MSITTPILDISQVAITLHYRYHAGARAPIDGGNWVADKRKAGDYRDFSISDKQALSERSWRGASALHIALPGLEHHKSCYWQYNASLSP